MQSPWGEGHCRHPRERVTVQRAVVRVVRLKLPDSALLMPRLGVSGLDGSACVIHSLWLRIDLLGRLCMVGVALGAPYETVVSGGASVRAPAVSLT